MSFLQNIIQKLTSLMKPLFGMCQVLEFYIKFKEHNKLKKPMVIDSLYILLSVSNFISQNADFWKKNTTYSKEKSPYFVSNIEQI